MDGIIHPIAAEYLTGVLDDAKRASAELAVVVLGTPGGLLESTRTIVSRIVSSHAVADNRRRTAEVRHLTLRHRGAALILSPIPFVG